MIGPDSFGACTPRRDRRPEILGRAVVTFAASQANDRGCRTRVELGLGGGLRVIAPDGNRVERTSVARDGDVEVATSIDSTQPGTYTVAWRAVSEDSHVLAGSFVFHVQRETGAVVVADADRGVLDVLAWLARWWIVAAMVVIGGLAAFGWFVSREGSLDPIARRLILALALIGLVGAVMRFAIQVATTSGRSLLGGISLWSEAVESTRAGRIDATRVVASIVVACAASAWWRRRALLAAMLGTTGVAFANAYGGHAWTVKDNSPALLASVVHQGAVAVWVGGLVGLTLLLRRASGAAAAARFSSIAAWALVATAASVAGWYRAGLLDDLFSTGYGRVILAKIALGLAMASLGYWNRAQLGAFVERRASIVRGARAEVALAVVALGLTAALVGMVPARSAAQGGDLSVSYDDAAASVSVTVTPARVGANTMHLYFYDTSGRPRTVDVAEA